MSEELLANAILCVCSIFHGGGEVQIRQSPVRPYRWSGVGGRGLRCMRGIDDLEVAAKRVCLRVLRARDTRGIWTQLRLGDTPGRKWWLRRALC